jgi:hypothetical protein
MQAHLLGEGAALLLRQREERDRGLEGEERERGVTFSMEEREATEIERRGDTGNVR